MPPPGSGGPRARLLTGLAGATCPAADDRDGQNAVRDAERARELLGRADGNDLATLAAADAEAGRFDEAVRWQKEALAEPEYASQHEALGRKVLNLYEEKTPYRE